MAPAEEFDALYRGCRDRLVTQLVALSGDPGGAADAVQEAFLRAWLRWERVVTYEDPEGWVRRVAYHLAVSRWRRARRLVLSHLPVSGREEAHEEARDEESGVISALNKLPLPQRTAIVLHHLGGLPVEQVAAEMSAPTGTVKSWLSRGRARLAAELRHEDQEVSS